VNAAFDDQTPVTSTCNRSSPTPQIKPLIGPAKALYSVDMSVSWFAPAKPDSIYSYEIMRDATPFINLTVLYVPNGAAFEIDVQ